MNDNTLMNHAMNIEKQVLDTTGKLMEVILNILSEYCKTEDEKNVFDSFKSYVRGGGEIMACPVGKDRLEGFKAVAEEIGLTYISVPEKGDDSVGLVLFRAKDSGVMDKVIERVGENLVKDMRLDADKFLDGLDNDGIDETGVILKKDLGRWSVCANKLQMPYSLRMSSNGDFIALTAHRDWQKLQRMDGFFGMQTEHYNESNHINEKIDEIRKDKDKEISR